MNKIIHERVSLMHHNISRYKRGMPKSMFGRPKVKSNKVTNVFYEEERYGRNLFSPWTFFVVITIKTLRTGNRTPDY